MRLGELFGKRPAPWVGKDSWGSRQQDLLTAVEDERNEVKVLKRKQAASLKELRTELSTMKRRLNAYESGTASLGGLSDHPVEGISMSSRASSVTSLEALAGHRSSTEVPSPVATTAPSVTSPNDSGSVNGHD
uniref:Uncharacterized protein n=1 Tax=Plectus sambesii TaxID=2011161 RepID=A0A914VFM2_9BILA